MLWPWQLPPSSSSLALSLCLLLSACGGFPKVQHNLSSSYRFWGSAAKLLSVLRVAHAVRLVLVNLTHNPWAGAAGPTPRALCQIPREWSAAPMCGQAYLSKRCSTPSGRLPDWAAPQKSLFPGRHRRTAEIGSQDSVLQQLAVS